MEKSDKKNWEKNLSMSRFQMESEDETESEEEDIVGSKSGAIVASWKTLVWGIGQKGQCYGGAPLQSCDGSELRNRREGVAGGLG